MLAFSYILLASFALCVAANPLSKKASCPQAALPDPLPAPTTLPNITTLPDPFVFFDNVTTVRSIEDWECRRQELLVLMQEYMYGFYPDHSKETVSSSRDGLTLNTTVSNANGVGSWLTTLSLPTNVNATPESPVPVVISAGGINNSVFLDNGIALATFNLPDVAADSVTPGGAFWELYSGEDIGVLLSWAWGFHRILDAIIQSVPEFDTSRVGVIGCSRDGKAALAAGMFDERITLTMPMSSGAEGIAPWRFQFQEFGENEKITNITGGFPYWSNTVLHQFVNNTAQIPFDAHLNAAMVAPRAIIWDEGTEDYWTNPEGEARVTFIGTEPVYNFLRASSKLGVAIQDSGHCDISGYTNIQAFALNQFFGIPTGRNYSDISPYGLFPSAYPWLAKDLAKSKDWF